MDTYQAQPQNDYQARREQKEQELRSRLRSRVFSRFLKWSLFLLTAGLIVFGLTKLSSRDSDPISGEETFSIQTRDHIAVGAAHPAYNSNPPTGGWHYDQPVQTGIYDREFPDEQIVHNLEHGHVWIAYRPDLSADQVEALADLAKSYGSQIVMAPRTANDAPIVLVVWGRLLKMETLDEAAAKDFIGRYRGVAGPERVPDFGFKDFRSL